MSIKILLCCDICNQEGYYHTDVRRTSKRHDGRRRGDGRRWHAIDVKIETDKNSKRQLIEIYEKVTIEAEAQGWVLTTIGCHYCIECYNKHESHLKEFTGEASELVDFLRDRLTQAS